MYLNFETIGVQGKSKHSVEFITLSCVILHHNFIPFRDT